MMPMVSPEFAQISIMKCRTTWAAMLARDELGNLEQKGNTHAPASSLGRRILDTRKLYAPFRNPWSWWVSWYCHVCNSVGQRALSDTYGRGHASFRHVLRGATQRIATDIPESPPLLAKWGAGLADDFKASGWGVYSWMSHRMLACGRPVTLLDCDSLTETLPAFLGIDKSAGAKHGPKNTGAERWKGRAVQSPEDPESWYDDEMIDWVWEADRWAIDLMAFEGPFQPAHEPVKVVCIPAIS